MFLRRAARFALRIFARDYSRLRQGEGVIAHAIELGDWVMLQPRLECSSCAGVQVRRCRAAAAIHLQRMVPESCDDHLAGVLSACAPAVERGHERLQLSGGVVVVGARNGRLYGRYGYAALAVRE